MRKTGTPLRASGPLFRQKFTIKAGDGGAGPQEGNVWR
jgi:hypothetical protein